MRILCLILVAGCATGMTVVPDSDWRTVPASERAEMERAHAIEVARTDADLAAAKVAAAQAHHATAARTAHRAVGPAVAPGDDWANAMRAYEHDRVTTMARIDDAAAGVVRATAEWRDLRVAELSAQLEMMRYAFEVDRARAVDHHLLGTDTYDGAAFRAQLAAVQDRYFAAMHRSEAAHDAMLRASAELASAKEQYASLVRRGPAAPTSTDDRLELTTMHASMRLGFAKRRGTETASYLVKPRR